MLHEITHVVAYIPTTPSPSRGRTALAALLDFNAVPSSVASFSRRQRNLVTFVQENEHHAPWNRADLAQSARIFC